MLLWRFWCHDPLLPMTTRFLFCISKDFVLYPLLYTVIDVDVCRVSRVY